MATGEGRAQFAQLWFHVRERSLLFINYSGATERRGQGGISQVATGGNGRVRSSQQQPPGKVPPAGRGDAAADPGGGADAGSETLAEPGLCAGRTPLCRRLAGLPWLPRSGQTHRWPVSSLGRPCGCPGVVPGVVHQSPGSTGSTCVPQPRYGTPPAVVAQVRSAETEHEQSGLVM